MKERRREGEKEEEEEEEEGEREGVLTTLKSLFRRCLHCLLVVASSSKTSKDTPRGEGAGIPGVRRMRTLIMWRRVERKGQGGLK